MGSIRWTLAAILTMSTALPAWAGSGTSVDTLRRQVQATDALGALLDQDLADDQVPTTPALQPATRPVPLPYDQVFRVAMRYVQESGDPWADPAISQLSEDQLRRELTVLHTDNLAAYLRLNARDNRPGPVAPSGVAPSTQPATMASRQLGWASADHVLARLKQRGGTPPRPTRRRPANSAIAALHVPEDAAPQYDLPHRIQSDAQRAAALEQPEASAATPQQVAASLMAGASMPGTFGVPSVVAPMNARRPGSEPIDRSWDSAFPMMAFVPGTSVMPATPPGTPAAVVPSPQTLQLVASLVGVSPDEAADLLRSGGTLAEMRQAARNRGSSRPGGFTLSTSATGLSAADPRWRTFYYGPNVRENGWQQGGGDPFLFLSGGGLYQRNDTRVNNDTDLRLNGDIDRRINAGNDRRLSVQVDPRVNY